MASTRRYSRNVYNFLTDWQSISYDISSHFVLNVVPIIYDPNWHSQLSFPPESHGGCAHLAQLYHFNCLRFAKLPKVPNCAANLESVDENPVVGGIDICRGTAKQLKYPFTLLHHCRSLQIWLEEWKIAHYSNNLTEFGIEQKKLSDSWCLDEGLPNKLILPINGIVISTWAKTSPSNND